ncbi:31268_t:CDS:2, partial [Racocetra persica]
YNQTTIDYGFKQSISVDKLKVIRNMQYVYFLAKHHYATHGLQDLKKLYDRQFDEESNEALFGPFIGLKKVQSFGDSPITVSSEYGTYDNDVSAREFIEAISFVIEESLIKKIQSSSYWSIQIDDSNTIKQEKILAIVSRHLSNNYPIARFLGIIQLEDAAARPIVDSINRFLLAKRLDISNIFHIGNDGASTILGKNNGVAYIFKKQNPFLLEHHCIAHRLALAAKDAAKKRMINLQLIEKKLEDPNLVLQIINTRWLSLSNVVSNLHRILDSVKLALEDFLENV